MMIRDIVPQDADRLVPFRRQLFAESDFLLYGPDEYSFTAQEIVSQIERAGQVPTNRSLVAEHEASFVGFVTVVGSPVPRLRHSALLGLGVLREWWGRGVATELMTEVFRWAPTVGITRLELSVMQANDRAMALYERLGFKLEGSRRRAYMVNGQPVDDHIMSYLFEGSK